MQERMIDVKLELLAPRAGWSEETDVGGLCRCVEASEKEEYTAMKRWQWHRKIPLLHCVASQCR